jgi:hypothetical protein
MKPIYECRCDERLKTKVEESTRLEYTGLLGELVNRERFEHNTHHVTRGQTVPESRPKID